MDIKIIQAGTEDYEEMIQLRMEVLLNPINIPVHYIDQEKEKGDILIAGYDEHKMIACCILTRISDDVVQLRQMAVSPFVQKGGVGKSLLQFAEKKALKNNFRSLMMHAREGVTGFYERCGYSQIEAPFEEVGIKHFKMIKQLC